MTDGQTETQEEVSTTMAIEFHEDKVYAANMWCPCKEKWLIKAVFLCKKDAVAHCEEKMRYAVRCNRPLEYWHVERFHLHPCAGEVVWGCCHAEQPDDLGAPDCV
jgi:hypothetical protein